MEQIVIVYRSRTGFTREYAELAAAKLGCRALPLEAAGREEVSGCDVLVFGGRVHAGRIDGLKRARALYRRCGAKRFVVFATGATPAAVAETIETLWRDNLRPEERARVPHFYMQSGLRLAGLSRLDRLILRAASAMLRRGAGREADAAAFASPRDISSPAYVEPMVRFLTEGGESSVAVETDAAPAPF